MFVTTGTAKIYTIALGLPSKPAILGIGGWIGGSELWMEPFAELSCTWRAIVYDHRGAGATVAPVESITFDQLVDDVFTLLDHYKIDQCVLAAESAGTLTALGAALREPQRITGLVIVDGLYYRKTLPEHDAFLTGLREAYAATLDRFVAACFTEPDSDHYKRWGRQISDRASQESAIALYLTASGIDLRSELHRIVQPTLILHGELDTIVKLEHSQQLASMLPNAQLVTIAGAGHVPAMTRPAEVAHQINRFFGHL